jgi:hypothetical protein
MHSHMTWDAQQHAVVRIVAQPLYLCLSLGGFEWYDMVAVNTRHDVPITLAPLAQPLRPLPHHAFGLYPSLVVQHPHVFWSVSRFAYTLTIHIRKV